MASLSVEARSILLSLCFLAVSCSPVPGPQQQGLQFASPPQPCAPPPCPQPSGPPPPPCSSPTNVGPIAPIPAIGPLAPPVIPPGPSEFYLVAPPPSADLLVPLGGIPETPSALEESVADLVPVAAPGGGAFAHVSSFVSPVQVSVNPAVPRIPGSAVEVVEPLMTIETAQCGCTIIRLYWLHEVITFCPLGTGRWAKTTKIGSAELMHEWVLTNTHDVLPNPHYHGPCPFNN